MRWKVRSCYSVTIIHVWSARKNSLLNKFIGKKKLFRKISFYYVACKRIRNSQFSSFPSLFSPPSDWQRLVVLLWLHNLCWYGCCLNKQPPETQRASEQGCIMMELWLRAYSSRHTHEHWRSCVFSSTVSASLRFITAVRIVFSCVRSLKQAKNFFCVFLWRNFRGKNPSTLETWHTWRSMWKNHIDRSKESERKLSFWGDCITRGKIYGTKLCSKHHKISKDK